MHQNYAFVRIYNLQAIEVENQEKILEKSLKKMASTYHSFQYGMSFFTKQSIKGMKSYIFEAYRASYYCIRPDF